MPVTWSDEAWDDYLAWQNEDKQTLKRINMLIKDIQRNAIQEQENQNLFVMIALVGGLVESTRTIAWFIEHSKVISLRLPPVKHTTNKNISVKKRLFAESSATIDHEKGRASRLRCTQSSH